MELFSAAAAKGWAGVQVTVRSPLTLTLTSWPRGAHLVVGWRTLDVRVSYPRGVALRRQCVALLCAWSGLGLVFKD